MGWVRVDDAFYDHGKFAEAGPLGIALWLSALAYSNRNLKDGFVSVSAARRLLDLQGLHWKAWDGELVGGCETVEPIELADHLVKCGLWEDALGGYLIHDYLDYQPSSEQVRESRRKNADRQARWASTQKADDSVSAPKADAPSNAGTNAVSDTPLTGAPNPNPKRTTKASSSADADAAFDQFWQAYPVKQGKIDARKAWDKAIRKTDPALIVAGAERYRADPNRDPAHSKWAQGWLSGARWTDPISPTVDQSVPEAWR